MLTVAHMPPLMFGGIIVFLLIGFPVAFSLAAVGLFFGFLSVELGFFPEAYLGNLPLRVFGILSNDLLLAIPFFTLMGAILERSGLAEDLLEGMGQLFGGVPGGLAFAVVIVGAILGAITGTVAASVIAMGMISLPIMMRYGYDMRIATGVIAASGTITQVIPPSLVLIVLADQLGRSVGDMYAGAIGPSILQVLLFLLSLPPWRWSRPIACRRCRRKPGRSAAGRWSARAVGHGPLGRPDLPRARHHLHGACDAYRSGRDGRGRRRSSSPPCNRRLTWPLINQAIQNTMRITSMVIFILIGSTVFSLVFQGVDGSRWIEHLLSHLPGGQIGFLIFVNIFVFFLAFFLDFFEIAFIIIPLLAPVASKLGIDLVWFGVLLCVNMQTSFMHPPFGFALFYLRGIAPKEVTSRDIYLGRAAMGRAAADSGGDRDLLAGVRDLLDRKKLEPRSGDDPHRASEDGQRRHRRAGIELQMNACPSALP